MSGPQYSTLDVVIGESASAVVTVAVPSIAISLPAVEVIAIKLGNIPS